MDLPNGQQKIVEEPCDQGYQPRTRNWELPHHVDHEVAPTEEPPNISPVAICGGPQDEMIPPSQSVRDNKNYFVWDLGDSGLGLKNMLANCFLWCVDNPLFSKWSL